MASFRAILALFALAAAHAAQGAQGYFSPSMAAVSGYKKADSSNNSTLYRIESNATAYDTAPYLAVLQGSRRTMGYDYAKMMGKPIEESYKLFLKRLLNINSTLPLETAEYVLGAALDWQWNKYLSDQTPQIYKDELAGMDDAGKELGIELLGQYVRRTITLANLPGDLGDVLLVIVRELFGDDIANKIGPAHPPTESFAGFCSMIAAWGTRTDKGQLFSGRNLDWNPDLGLNKYKTIIVFKPDDAHAHATVGYAPLWGAITGMSAMGLTVHEANLEENRITFEGVPWLLRLRMVMEQADNLQGAKAVWDTTNNTVGFNHMVASAPDAAAGRPAALAMETMFNYTAYFQDGDKRESVALDKNQKHIGAPMSDALWRTNHGYDPIIREHFEWGDDLASNTVFRYMIIHDALKTYEEEKRPISLLEMTNITAVVGNNGGNDRTKYYACSNTNEGSNVISAAFDTKALTMAVAWERSSGANWRPACCSPYIVMDMTKWFQ